MTPAPGNKDPATAFEEAENMSNKTTQDLLQVYDGLESSDILVLGDLILDRYTWGNAERISQEAPILVLHADQQETKLGGAANVCQLVRGLQAQVCCAGVTGDDVAGQTLSEMLQAAGVQTDLVLIDSARPTTIKERFVGRAAGRHPNQILRVDHELSDGLDPIIEAKFIAMLEQKIPQHQVLLISDYGKGVCTPAVLQAAIRVAKVAGVQVLVDPARGADYQSYRGATLMKPNRTEVQQATGVTVQHPQDACSAGHQLCSQLDVDYAIVTLDRDGMVIVDRHGQSEFVTTTARSVYDITGAGDMALAMLGVALGGGALPVEAARLANVAAGLEVERMGVCVIHPAEIRDQLADHRVGSSKIVSCEQAAKMAAEHRRLGRRVVFTNGCFDLLHAGHVVSLSEAASYGDLLVVGMNSDASVRRLKGEQRPVIDQADRASLLAALECVDLVVPFDDDTPHKLLETIQPDVLVKGGSYTTEQVVGHEVVKAYGGQIVVTNLLQGVSTTDLVRRIQVAKAA